MGELPQRRLTGIDPCRPLAELQQKAWSEISPTLINEYYLKTLRVIANMKIDNIRTLVNFRLDSVTLKAFDDACKLSGSTRTAVLRRLIRAFTAKTAGSIPKQIVQERKVYKTLRTAVERAERRKRALEPESAGSAFRHRPRKGFAEFIANHPVLPEPS